MSISKERLEEVASFELDEYGDNYELRKEWQLFARALLAGMEQEPFGYVYLSKNGATNFRTKKPRPRLGNSESMPLYAAPVVSQPAPSIQPAPVAVPVELTDEQIDAVLDDHKREHFRMFAREILRAAMLNGGKS